MDTTILTPIELGAAIAALLYVVCRMYPLADRWERSEGLRRRPRR